MMWKKLVSGVVSLSVVCASLTTASIWMGKNAAAAEEADPLVYQQRYEAEEGDVFGGAEIQADHTGYTGSGFVAQFSATPGRGVTVTVDVPRTDTYMVGVRYSAAGTSTIGVYTGEDEANAKTMNFGGVKGSWEGWSTSYIALELAKGENDITFFWRDGVEQGAINIDSVTVTDSVIYEAEDATTFPGEHNLAADHTGYSGRGFMAHYNQDGNGTEFHVNADRAGVYTVAFRYQSAQGDTRTLSLYVNEEETAYAVSFPRNNQDWADDIWTYATINLPLQAGENILRLQKEDRENAGYINIDYLAVPNRLLAATEVSGGIPNGDFANEDPNDVPTDWATDTGDNKHMGVNDASPVAGKNVYLWDGGGEFKQGISQTLTGLEEGWYAVTFYKQNNDIVPKSQQVELVAADGVGNQLVMPYTTGGQWQAVEMVAKVGESGQLTLHASIDGNKGSSLMLGKFQLFKLTDKSELYDQIAAGAGLSSEDYTASSWQAYQTALTTAQDVLANSGSQPAIDAAASDLEAKRTALEEPVEETYTASQQIVDQKYEAEDAQLLNGAEINTDHTGYTGTGFIGQIDQGADRGIAFTVNVPRADTYTIGIRYAASQNTTMGIWSGGDASAAKTVQMVRSWNYPDNTNGSWENWSTAYTTLDLQKGENVITLQRRDTDSNVANIDFITVTDGVLYEAEDGEIIPEHREPATDHVNYSGRGFMAGLGDTGRGIVFDVNVDRAGIYTVAFAYQSSHDSTRTMNVYVNDGDTASTVSFAKNNRDWSEDVWSRVYVNLELQAGDNTIKLIKDEENNGDINIDYMMVSNRLWELEDVTDSIQNPRFADGLTGWTMDDPDGVNYKVVDTDNGIAGNTLLRMGDSAEAFKQGVSQTVTGLDDGWYILAMYKLVGGPVQNRIDLEVTTGEGGTDGVLHLGNTPNNVWVVVSAAVQVVGGEMTIHVSNDATGDSYLQITQFHLYKVLDRTELYDQIASGSDLKAEDYTPDSWQAYQTALTAANAAMTEATAQKTLDTAARILAARQGELAPVDGSHTISLVSPAGADITLSSTAAKEGDTVTVQINALPAGQVLDTITAADAGGNPVTLTAGENGVYTFTMPDSNVTVTVTLKAAALTIKSVEALAALTVDYGTAYADLELPETVKVTLSDDTTADAAITWAEGDYDGNTADTYTLTGTLRVEGAENPDNLTASIQVTVKEEVTALTIKSVEALAALTVDYGTAYADLELPETVKVTLSDDTTAEAAITWAEGNYDGETAGTYTLTGTLSVEGAENPDNLTASIQVTVEEEEVTAPTIKSVEALAALTVDYGTAYADLQLPETVKVTLSNDTTADAAITWAEGDYDGETAGTYTLTGTLTVEGAENPDNLTASIQVTVKEEVVATPTIKSVEDLTALTVDYGTAYADLELPETVKVTLSDDTTADAAITWAEGDYDGNTAGTYTLTGTLRVDGAENPDNLTASIQVTVKEKESVTYTVSVEAGENGTVTPGSLQVEAGEDAVFTITPDEGYTVEEIAISPAVENTLENGVLTIADVQADTKVTVTFKLLDADEETAVLEEALSDANQLLEEAVTGDAPGQYPAAAIEAFQAAVAEAQAVLEDENADAAALAEAVTRLAHAQEVFLAARIADDVNSGDDSSNSDNSTSDTPDSGTSSGDGTATNGGSQTGTEQSDNFKTGSAIPALAVSLLALSAGAVWMTGRKRRTK